MHLVASVWLPDRVVQGRYTTPAALGVEREPPRQVHLGTSQVGRMASPAYPCRKGSPKKHEHFWSPWSLH